MKALRQVNTENCPNYCFNSITNIKNFDTNLLSINQIAFMTLNILKILTV